MSTLKQTVLIMAMALPLAISTIVHAQDITVKVPHNTKTVTIEVADPPAKPQSRTQSQTPPPKEPVTTSWPKRVCLEKGDTLSRVLGITWQEAQTVAKNLGFASGHDVHVGCYVVNKDLTARRVRS